MTIRQLEYFCAVAEGRSISAAARALHVAQPPISRQIAQLGSRARRALFARESRGMKLTEAGQTLYRQSRSLFLNLRRVEENVRSIGAVRAGATTSASSTPPCPMPCIIWRRTTPAIPRSNSTSVSVPRRTF